MMLSVFTYIFSAFVSWYSGRHFFRAWKEGGQPSHWEFGMFFYVLAAALFVNALVGIFAPGLLAALFQELSDLLTIVSFGFVVRACIRFQKLPVSFRTVNAAILAALLARFFVGITHLPEPMVQSGLIFARYSFASSATQGALVILFTFLTAVTLFSNLKNIQQKKGRVFLLGLTFIIGGIGGALVGASDFTPILIGNIMMLVCFTMLLLLMLRISKQEDLRVRTEL